MGRGAWWGIQKPSFSSNGSTVYVVDLEQVICLFLGLIPHYLAPYLSGSLTDMGL